MAQRKTTHRKVMTLNAPGLPPMGIIEHRRATEDGAEIMYVLNVRLWDPNTTCTRRTHQLFKSASFKDCVQTAANLLPG